MKHFLFYILFLIIVIIYFAYINSLNKTENFTPKIREYYRPILRNYRILKEGFYHKTSSNISNLFRKFGII